MSSARLEEALQLTQDLLRISSETGDEVHIADHVESWCRGFDPHQLVRSGNSLCVTPRPLDPTRQTVMLLGHLDTVPSAGENPVRVEGDRLFGLGASDMKAADALIMQALRRGGQEGCRHNLIGVLYAREEGPFVESELPGLIEAAPDAFSSTDFAVAMEPTDNRIELGCLGTLHARVVFTGKRAHSARPWQGKNAIHAAAGLLQRLADFQPREYEFEGFTFIESMSATMIDFDGARNVIPSSCAINVNFRFAPGKDEEDCRRDLDAIVAGEASFEIEDFCPSGKVCADNGLLAELRQAAGSPETTAKQAWTDVGRLSHLGMDAINWGPGATAQAHQAGEWVSVAAVEASLETIEHWLFSAD